MFITKMIEKLEALKEEHGDISFFLKNREHQSYTSIEEWDVYCERIDGVPFVIIKD